VNYSFNSETEQQSLLKQVFGYWLTLSNSLHDLDDVSRKGKPFHWELHFDVTLQTLVFGIRCPIGLCAQGHSANITLQQIMNRVLSLLPVIFRMAAF